MVKNFIFDFGKVLVDYDFEHVFQDFFPQGGELLEEYRQVVLGSDFMDRCDKEDIPLEQIIDAEKQRYPHLAAQFQMFYDRFEDFILGEMEGMRPLLLRLKEKGYRLYGLTNWSSKVYPVMERYPIFRLLDGQVISSEEHLIKPDVAIYHRLCEKYNLLPAECLFADDKAVNIEGARKAGMQAVLFTTAAKYIQDIKAIIPDLQL